MLRELQDKSKAISVIGLGYVGLPLALEFAKQFRVIGFDINEKRVQMMRNHIDPSKELESSAFENTDIRFTSDSSDLSEAHFHIVAVPTPIDSSKLPVLIPVINASQTVGRFLKKGDYVVYESTVYPGCTEEDCLPILEKESGLKLGKDFKIGYSPERINPGDKERTLTKILKIVSGSDEMALNVISAVYESIIEPGVHKAPSINVAEAAKVIENTQRDLNIALMNELSMIFDMMDIDTRAVLEAAGTKWNFLKFSPGLVGGHCIGVDPYYLTFKARKIGYSPNLILSGRSVNDQIPVFIASKLVQDLIALGKNPKDAKVLVMGITFKENVSDIRNSKVSDLIKELEKFSLTVDNIDPYASADEVRHEYAIELKETSGNDYDAVVVAVNHDEYKELGIDYFSSICNDNIILYDLKGIYNPESSDWQKENGDLLAKYWRM